MAAVAAGSAGEKTEGGRRRRGDGERGNGESLGGSSEKDAWRKGPDVFIAMPTSLLHLLSALFLGKGRERREVLDKLIFPLTSQSSGPYCRLRGGGARGEFGAMVVW